MSASIDSSDKRQGILVVCAEPAITVLLTRAFSFYGWEVCAARNTEAAVAAYASGRIGLVFLDEDLLAAAFALRRADPEVRIVLAASGIFRERPIADLDVVWGVPKPFPSFAQLSARLRELL